MHSSWWLNALIVWPFVAAGLIAVLRVSSVKFLAVAFAAIEAAFAVLVWCGYRGNLALSGTGGADYVSHTWWARSLGLAHSVGVDGISLLMVVLTAIVGILALAGTTAAHHERSYSAWLLILVGASMGAFVTRDLMEFFLFFELTLIPSYFLISRWGGKDATRAALKFFIYTLFGSGFLLVGAIYLAVRHYDQTGILSFDYAALHGTVITTAASVWVMVGFLIAFGVKSPLWPLHTWSPLAYAEAPTAGSMMLSAILAKLGTYGLLRFGVLMLPGAVAHVAPYVLTLAVVGILYGSALAAVSKDLKRLVAYSSLAQVGFIMLGLFSQSATAISGSVLLMFNHGVITAAFFLLIGGLEKRRGTSLISDLRGLQGPAPVLAGIFTVVMLASIGVPGLSGFISEYLVLAGTFATHPWWSVVATTGVIFAALYLLWAYQRVFHGLAEGENAQIADATTAEKIALAPLIALIVVLGIYPQVALSRASHSVNSQAPATWVTDSTGQVK